MISINVEDFDIKKIAESGQCFRLNQEGDHWINIAGDRVVRIYENKLDCSKRDYNSFWKPYFDLETDYSAFRDKIPKKDKFLISAAEFGKGIRILKQDPWEMLITFIISQRKSIPAIKSSVESLCLVYGNKISESEEVSLYAFPDVSSLASATESKLKECGLGYRVPYIISAARMVDSGQVDLDAIAKLSDEELIESLMSIKGVGIKVANCVSLFGYHRIDAFPIDVWISRVLEEKYDNNFPLKRYDGFAGVIQQYMFYYARNNAKSLL